MKRKIEQILEQWKNDPQRKPIVLKGCRQCGKTYSVMDFAQKHYRTIFYNFKSLLLQYIVVGGMPEVVQTFVAQHNIGQVLRIQRRIVQDYRSDMLKYAPQELKPIITESFDSIPIQLSRENKKFMYSAIRTGARSKNYRPAIQWMEDAGIIQRCRNLQITELPLDGNTLDDCFKVYMTDTGLFVSLLEDGTQADILSGNLLGYKGAIYENLLGDILGKMGRKLYYFHKDGGLEIDFILRYKGKCTLLECKARSGHTKSTRTILNNPEHYNVHQAIKLGDYNVGRNGNLLTLPLYMAFLLKEN